MLVGVLDVREMPSRMMSAVVQVLRQLAVVVRHGEVQRVDAPEIVGVEHVLAGHHGRLRRAEIGSRTPA